MAVDTLDSVGADCALDWAAADELDYDAVDDALDWVAVSDALDWVDEIEHLPNVDDFPSFGKFLAQPCAADWEIY